MGFEVHLSVEISISSDDSFVFSKISNITFLISSSNLNFLKNYLLGNYNSSQVCLMQPSNNEQKPSQEIHLSMNMRAVNQEIYMETPSSRNNSPINTQAQNFGCLHMACFQWRVK